MYTLTKYDKFQNISEGTFGEVIMEHKYNMNGFFEKIFELGLDKYVFKIKSNNNIIHEAIVGTFDDNDNKIKLDAKISNAAKNLLDSIYFKNK